MEIEEKEIVKKILNKTKFTRDEVNILYSMYKKYIDGNSLVCTSCASGVEFLIKKLKNIL